MTLTNFPNGISSFGIPIVGNAPLSTGLYLFVDGTNGANGNSGRSTTKAMRTLQQAINNAASYPGSVVLVAPGTYDETITIARPTTSSGSTYMTIMGMGPLGDVRILPTTTDANGMLNNADYVSLINLSISSDGTGTGLTNTGSYLRCYDCRFSNEDATGLGMIATLGTAAQVSAGTHGTGANCSLFNCRFTGSASGLRLTCTGSGAVSNLLLDHCRFYDLATTAILESVGSGGAAATTYRGLQVLDCTFGRVAAGTEPTSYITLNANNANSGIVTRSSFPTAIAGGKNLVSTACIWTSNYHTGGVSGAQPS